MKRIGGAALGLLLAGASGSGEAARNDEEAVVRAEAAVPRAGQPAPAPDRARVELFGRAGLVLLHVSATDSLGVRFGPEADGVSVSGSRFTTEFGGGAGARLLYGNWGIEGSYAAFSSLDLSPGGLPLGSEAGGEPAVAITDTLRVVASRADLFVFQALGALPLGRGGVEVSIGLGAGWLRVSDSTTDDLLAGAWLPEHDPAAAGIPLLVPEIEFEADRNSIVPAGSLGVAFRLGRLLLRPRVDVAFGRALTTGLSIALPEIDELAAGPEIYRDTSLKPTVVLFSVDIGLSS